MQGAKVSESNSIDKFSWYIALVAPGGFFKISGSMYNSTIWPFSIYSGNSKQ